MVGETAGDRREALRTRIGGLSLLEVLFALTILGVALLSSLAVLGQRARYEETLDAHRRADRSLTIALETLRGGGALPSEPTPATGPGGAAFPWSSTMPPGAVLWSVDRSTDVPAIREVEIVVRYPGVGRVHVDRRTTLVLSP